jgi:hypothetical protein
MARRRIDKSDYHEQISTQDKVLLDEFFSLVANIAVRLTKTDVRAKNGDNLVKQEANER